MDFIYLSRVCRDFFSIYVTNEMKAFLIISPTTILHAMMFNAKKSVYYTVLVNFRLFFHTCSTRIQNESPWYCDEQRFTKFRYRKLLI